MNDLEKAAHNLEQSKITLEQAKIRLLKAETAYQEKKLSIIRGSR